MPQPEQSRPSILIIEHDRGVRTLLTRLVNSWGYDALPAESETSGLRLLGGDRAVALVMSDFQPTAGDRTTLDYLTRPSDSPAPPLLCTFLSPLTPEGVPSVRRPFDMQRLRDIVTDLVGEG